jgi:CubicO group peptidase (beta-lactamase class C family)
MTTKDILLYANRAGRSRFCLVMAALLFLQSCGGGGGSGKKQPDPPPVNQAPISNAGMDQSVDEGAAVNLAGTGTDSDGTIATYSWQQDGGTDVTISNSDMAGASFIAPMVGASEDLTFTLTVRDDDAATASDTVTVAVQNVNVQPIANAGADQIAITGVSVALDGSASWDADGDSLTYLWSLTSAPASSSATINDASTIRPTFVPDVDGSYVAELVVNDGLTNSESALVTISTSTPPFGTLGDGQLESIVETVLALGDLPAIAVIVVKKDMVSESTAVGQRAMGFPDLVSTADKWHIGSLTKAMTGTLVAMYVEQSLLDWDTRPIDVWPELAQSIHPDYVDVTLAHLLTHRAGLAFQMYNVPSVAALQDNAPGTVASKRRLWAEELLALPSETAIGSYRYTNSSYIVAGAMLETLTGDTWENMIQMNLFGPLGMVDSGFGAPGTQGQLDQPRGHRVSSGVLQPIEPGPGSDNVVALGPAGTVHTTMADYSNFMIMHINGARGISGLVTAQTFEFLHRPPVGSYYATGWIIENEPNGGGRVLLHLGSNNLWVAKVRLMPDIEAGVFLVVNASNTDARQAIATLESQITERILATP